jgi:quercetin dioxygenase-like cupin family protein
MTLFAMLLTAAIAQAGAPAAAPHSTEEITVVRLKDAKYTPNTAKGVPPGVSGSPIGADPATKGPTGYTKFAAGTKFPEHTHTYTEYSALVQGNATLTIADKTYEMSAGDYAIIPGKTPHSLSCHSDGDCVQLTRRAGPNDYAFTGK